MAPAKRRQEEGAGVKSCQRKDDLLRFEDTDCFQCCDCVKMMSLMIPMVGWQEWRFNRTILLQNLLQLAGSVKSQNQSRGHVVILAIPSSSTLDDLPCFFVFSGGDQTWMNLQVNVQLDIFGWRCWSWSRWYKWECELGWERGHWCGNACTPWYIWMKMLTTMKMCERGGDERGGFWGWVKILSGALEKIRAWNIWKWTFVNYEDWEDEQRFYLRHCSSCHPSKMRPLGCSCSPLLTTTIIVIIWIFVAMRITLIMMNCHHSPIYFGSYQVM